jgi:hypothetical protein
MSIPHICIGPGRWNRLNDDRGRFRGLLFTSPCRAKIRLIVETDGTTKLTSAAPAHGSGRRSSSSRIRFAPQRECSRRNSNTARSTRSGD